MTIANELSYKIIDDIEDIGVRCPYAVESGNPNKRPGSKMIIIKNGEEI
jgi:hypothetical protein